MMATQICPNCNADSFTWSLNEKNEKLTIWHCYICKYVAFEDESLERLCTHCNKKTKSYMQDEEKFYWWCSHCGKITIQSEKIK